MDMMHAQVVGIKPAAPTGLDFCQSRERQQPPYELTWVDNSKNETAFVIERGWLVRPGLESPRYCPL